MEKYGIKQPYAAQVAEGAPGDHIKPNDILKGIPQPFDILSIDNTHNTPKLQSVTDHLKYSNLIANPGFCRLTIKAVGEYGESEDRRIIVEHIGTWDGIAARMER